MGVYPGPDAEPAQGGKGAKGQAQAAQGGKGQKGGTGEKGGKSKKAKVSPGPEADPAQGGEKQGDNKKNALVPERTKRGKSTTRAASSRGGPMNWRRSP